LKFLQRFFSLNQILWSFIVSGTMARVVTCFQHNPLDYLASDPARHWRHAEIFFQPRLMELSDPIGYQVYLLLLRALTGDNRYLIVTLCALLSALMPWFYYRASREFKLPKERALAVWAVIVWTPSLFKIYQYFMPETLLLALVGLSFWMTGRSLRRGDFVSWVFTVFFWTLAVLTKITVMPVAGVCLAHVWFKKSRGLKWFLGGALVAFLLILPNALRTYNGLGYVAPFGNLWITKIQHRSGAHKIQIDSGKLGRYYFISPSCFVKPFEPINEWMIRRAGQATVAKVKINPQNGESDWRQAYADLGVGKEEWGRQLKENLILFFWGPSWPEGIRSWSGWWTFQLRWLFAPLVFWVLILNFRQFSKREFQLIPMAVTFFIFTLALQNQVTAEGRYRKPLEVLLILNLAAVLPVNKKSSEESKSKTLSR